MYEIIGYVWCTFLGIISIVSLFLFIKLNVIIGHYDVKKQRRLDKQNRQYDNENPIDPSNC